MSVYWNDEKENKRRNKKQFTISFDSITCSIHTTQSLIWIVLHSIYRRWWWEKLDVRLIFKWCFSYRIQILFLYYCFWVFESIVLLLNVWFKILVFVCIKVGHSTSFNCEQRMVGYWLRLVSFGWCHWTIRILWCCCYCYCRKRETEKKIRITLNIVCTNVLCYYYII